MNHTLTEMVVIGLLLAANGVFAMTEIAVVSARRPRLKRLADQGDQGAKAALELAESPNRFLSTVQVGITLVGVLAGAFGGATLAKTLAQTMRQLPWISGYADAVALTIVVAAITYFSIVIGELVPKRLALNHPESISRFMARPMMALANLANPLVNLLSASTDLLLRCIGIKAQDQPAVTEDEVRSLVREGLKAGVLYQAESEMVESVLALDQLPVRDIMTPRAKIIWLNVVESHQDIWHKIVVSGHTSFPVYEGQRDNVIGMVSVKAIYANLAASVPVQLKDLMTPPQVVPASQSAIQLLENFRRTGQHVALVADEFGGLIGLVTLHDVMEAIVGDFPSQDERLRPAAKRRDDGTWLIDAMIEIDDLKKLIPALSFQIGADRDYQTLAGFIVKRLGHVPREGETFEEQGYLFEIIDMDRHRVDKVLLLPVKPPLAPPCPPPAAPRT
jgi:putative hemolysin